MKQLCLIILSLLCISASASAQNMSAPETRGVWVTGNYVQGGNDAIETLMRNVKSANLNTVYLCTWYQGATIYPSKVVPQAGGPAQVPEFTGTDPMKATIEIAHKYGIQVIAWFEYGLSVGVSTDNKDFPNIIKIHPDWPMVKRDTTIKYDLDSGNNFFWIDPAVSAAADFMVDLYQECAKNYPDIDGIELDRMRYPSTSFSYSDTARTRFMKETNNRDPLFLTDDNSAWCAWRRIQVTNLIKRIYDAVKSVNSNCVVTGAVAPPYMMYGGDQDKLQGWDVWAKNSYVDMLEPMLYLTTGDFPYQMSKSISYVPSGFNIAAGIAINSAGSVDNTIYEIKKARTAGSTGQVTWYYGYLLSYANAPALLKANVYQTTAAPAYDDLIMDDASKGLYTSTGSWTVLQGGYNDTYRKAPASAGDTAIYKVRILRDGQYNIYGYWSGDSAGNSSKIYADISSKKNHALETINQKTGIGKWNYVKKLNLSSGDTVTIKLYGSDVGNIIADAFRIKRGGSLQIEDKAFADSQSVVIRFSEQLLNPASPATGITSSINGDKLKFSIDNSDNSVLHITIPKVSKGTTFTLNINNLFDVYYDTLTVSLSLTYDPDKSSFLIDDGTPDSFWKLAGTWNKDTSYTAENGSYYIAKPGISIVRAQWGPVKIAEDGYYDVYVNIPKTTFPLTEKGIYVMRDHYKQDTIYVSQVSSAGSAYKLGSFPFAVNDVFALLLTSAVGSDTTKYLAADAVLLKRSVEISGIEKNQAQLTDFSISQNYPNPFNPATTINVELKNSGKVFVDIYNILGEKVTSLLTGKDFNQGKWNIKFDASNLPSGIYLAYVRIKSNASEVRKTVKMMLLK